MKSLFRSVGTSFAFNVAGSLLSGIVLIVAIRSLELDEWAKAAAILGIGQLLGSVLNFGSSVDRIRTYSRLNRDMARKSAAADTITRLRYALGLLAIAGLLSWVEPFLGAVLVVASGAFVSLSTGAYLSSRGRFTSAGSLLLIEKFLVLGTFVAITLNFGATYLTLPLVQGIGAMVGGLISICFLELSVMDILRHLWSKPVNLWQSFFMGVSTVSPSLMLVDVSLVLAAAGSYEAGLYAAATRIVAPLNVVATSVTAVILPHASSETRRRFRLSLSPKLGLAVMLMAGGLALVLVTAPYWVPVVLGEIYAEAVWVVRLCLLNVVAVLISRTLVAVIQGWNNEKFAALALVSQVVLALLLVALLAGSGGALAAAAGILAANTLLVIVLIARVHQLNASKC